MYIAWASYVAFLIRGNQQLIMHVGNTVLRNAIPIFFTENKIAKLMNNARL